MVASGVASKGLDFSEIQHVINFSMPKEIEVRLLVSLLSSGSRRTSEADSGSPSLARARSQDYVHQIGRTGRSGKTGIATTFVNMQTAEQTLLDLKYLLMEAKQKCVLLPLPPSPRPLAALSSTSLTVSSCACAGSRRSSPRSRTRTWAQTASPSAAPTAAVRPLSLSPSLSNHVHG